MTSMDAATMRIVARVRDEGPMRFDEFVEVALYHPEAGFYAAGRGAGRRRDFLTSPEVGPLFGAVVARALDSWWTELGRPDPFMVVDAGAGPGTLARAILAAQPACSAALRLVLVEIAPALRAMHPDGVVSRPDMPSTAEAPGGAAIVLANELLDNLPFRLAERTEDGWCEIRVGLAQPGAGAGDASATFAEVRTAMDAPTGRRCAALAADAAVGARIPVQDRSAAWLSGALAVAGPGRVVVVDYASATTASLAARPSADWLRTYRGHGQGGHPLVQPGEQDITCEVAVDQLAAVRPPDHDRTQAAWLTTHGVDELVAEGRRVWSDRAGIGDLAAIRARSRIGEAEALTDPSGLGAFRILEWIGTTETS